MKSGMKRILAIVGIVVVASAAAVVSSMLVLRNAEVGAEAAEAEAAEPEVERLQVVVALDPFITDLADRQRPRYLDVKISLVVAGEEEAAHVQDQQPFIRDVVLDVLRTQTAADLAGPGGKAHLTNAIGHALAETLGLAAVERILITDMMVQ